MNKRNISILAVVIALTVTLYFFYINKRFLTGASTGPFPMDWSINIPQDDTSFGGLFASPDINDSLPHYTYKRIEDSLKRIFDARQLDNKSHTLSGRTYGPLGVFAVRKTWVSWWDNNSKNDPLSILMNDSLTVIGNKFINQNNPDSLKKYKEEGGNIMWRYNVRQNQLFKEKQKKEEKTYYLALNGYNLEYDTKFFIQNGSFNLAYVKWDSIIKRKYDSTQVGHYERKQIPVRYATEEKRVLVPISKKQYRFLYGTLSVLTFVWLFLFVYFFIGLPIQILINISKGKAFNTKNILRFKIMAYILFAYALIITLAPFVLRFFFRNMIPTDFQM